MISTGIPSQWFEQRSNCGPEHSGSEAAGFNKAWRVKTPPPLQLCPKLAQKSPRRKCKCAFCQMWMAVTQKWNSKKFWRCKCKLVNSLTPLIPASCRSCHVSRKKSELKKWLRFKPVVVRFAVQVATCCHSSDMFQLGLLVYWGVHCESCIIWLLACQYRSSSCHPTMKSCRQWAGEVGMVLKQPEVAAIQPQD